MPRWMTSWMPSTPSSGPWLRPSRGPWSSGPEPARARPAPSPTALPTPRGSAPMIRGADSPSPSRPAPPVRCVIDCFVSASRACRCAPFTPRPCVSSGTSGRAPSAVSRTTSSRASRRWWRRQRVAAGCRRIRRLSVTSSARSPGPNRWRWILTPTRSVPASAPPHWLRPRSPASTPPTTTSRRSVGSLILMTCCS